jgi:hypothetical protein
VDLNPSVAIFPLRLAQGLTSREVSDSLFARIEALVGREPASGDLRKNLVEVQSIRPELVGGWIYTGAVYLLDVAPSWLERTPPPGDDADEIEDGDNPKAGFRQRIWHLALIGVAEVPGQVHGRLIIHATQDTVADRLREFVIAGRFGSVLTADPCGVPFDDRALQAVCLEGEARQAAFWGLHRAVKTKPDRKSLMGLDLKEAIDPFSDQTYRLTSAVSLNEGQTPKFLGLSLKHQRVWSHKGKKIDELSATLNALFGRLEAVSLAATATVAGLGQKGFRDLAKTSDPAEILKAEDAFEAAFRPLSDLEPLPEGANSAAAGAPALKAEKELAWFVDGHVKLGQALPNSPGFTLEVSRRGEALVTLMVTPVVEADGVALSVSSNFHVAPTHPDLELFEHLIEGDGLGRRLAVWYDTGHVLVDRQVGLLEYRDVRFDAWEWRTLKVKGVDVVVTQEKPTKQSQKDATKLVADLEAIGQQQSLFDYCLDELPRLIPSRTAGPLWTLCDDGSGEIADFIFFVPTDRRLWLVHAKGADSDAAGRKISVAAYEQVVSQARKNLRYFDGPLLAEELAHRDAGKPLLWRDGVRVTGGDHAAAMSGICQALKGMHFFEDRRLVVLQPHVSRASWTAARSLLAAGNDSHQSVKSYRLLSALLADLQITAQKVDAGFLAIGPEAPPAAAPPVAAPAPVAIGAA